MANTKSLLTTTRKKFTRGPEKGEVKLAYLLLIPSLVVFIGLAFYPLGSVFFASFTDSIFASSKPAEFVGIQNYRKLLSLTVKELPPEIDEQTGKTKIDPETGDIVYVRPIRILPREPIRFQELRQFNMFGKRYVIGATDRRFIQGTWDTLVFTLGSVSIELLLGLGIALVLNSNFKGRGPMRAIMLVPWAVPTAVSSRMWAYIFASTRVGFVNVLTQKLGLGDGQIAFLTEEAYQIWVMVIIDVWKTTPFMALLILAGLQTIPRQLYEAADVDGASPLRQFWSVTLPTLRQTIAIALVFRTLDALRVFDLFQIVFAQKRVSMASFTYYQLIDNKAMGYASASSVVIFIIILLFAMLYIRTIGSVDSDE